MNQEEMSSTAFFVLQIALPEELMAQRAFTRGLMSRLERRLGPPLNYANLAIGEELLSNPWTLALVPHGDMHGADYVANVQRMIKNWQEHSFVAMNAKREGAPVEEPKNAEDRLAYEEKLFDQPGAKELRYILRALRKYAPGVEITISRGDEKYCIPTPRLAQLGEKIRCDTIVLNAFVRDHIDDLEHVHLVGGSFVKVPGLATRKAEFSKDHRGPIRVKKKPIDMLPVYLIYESPEDN